MLCPLTAFFTSFYTGYVNLQLLFEVYHVMVNGRNGDPLQSMLMEVFAAWIFVGTAKLLLCAVQKCRRIGNFNQSRISILLGLVLISSFSVLGGVFIEKILEDYTTTAFAFFTVNGCCASYMLLVRLPAGNLYWNPKTASRLYEVLLVVLVSVQGASFIKTIMEVTCQQTMQAFLVVEFCYFLIGTSSSADALAIIVERIEEKKEGLYVNGKAIEVE